MIHLNDASIQVACIEAFGKSDMTASDSAPAVWVTIVWLASGQTVTLTYSEKEVRDAEYERLQLAVDAYDKD